MPVCGEVIVDPVIREREGASYHTNRGRILFYEYLSAPEDPLVSTLATRNMS